VEQKKFLELLLRSSQMVWRSCLPSSNAAAQVWVGLLMG
jgi:hypothetical protein